VNGFNTQGFYPPGAVKRDDWTEEGFPKGCLIIPTTVAQDEQIRKFIEERRRNPGTWRPGRDCSNFVHDALKAGGINVDDSTWPDQLFRNIQRITPYSCLQ
jgi:hypothetical protein